MNCREKFSSRTTKFSAAGRSHSINTMSYNKFKIAVISDLEDFNNFRDAWNRLTEANGFYTPWFCWEWFNLIIRHAESITLHIIVVYHNNELFAIAPMEIRTEQYKGFIPARVVSFIGGNRAFLKGIVFGSASVHLKKEASAFIFNYLCKDFRSWDLIELEPLAYENEDDLFFTELLKWSRLSFRKYISFKNRYCDAVCVGFDNFFQNIPQRTRKDIRYCQRRLENNGTLTFQMITGGSDLQTHLDAYDDIRARSWKAPERDHIFNREFICLAAAKGWLRLGIPSYNDQPIAGQKWFVSHRKAYIYDVLYDDNLKKYSPGKILTALMFQYVIDNDHIVYADYLRGDELYKKDWAPLTRERVGFTIFNNTFIGKIISILLILFLPIFKRYCLFMKKNNIDKQENSAVILNNI